MKRLTRVSAYRFSHPLLFLLLLGLLSSHRASAQSHDQASTDRFLIVSDIHFNPMADPALVADLAAADPTQWESILSRSKRTSFSQYGEDTNWWLLQSSLNAMRATLPHPAFILTNGDLLAHQFPQTYQKITHDPDRKTYSKFVRKTVEFLALELRKRFPNASILLTPGNNDDECGNYSIEARGRFLHDTADLARKLAHSGDEFRSSWEALGSYDIPHPTAPGVRIISLNTVFLSARYHAQRFSENCAQVDSTAASDLFTWLDSRLSRAQQNHEKVWLMFHIPPGIDSYFTIQQHQHLLTANAAAMTQQQCTSTIVPMWVPKWTAQFDDLLEKYAGTILAAFGGHTHNDDFRVVHAGTAHPTFILINPAISPVYRENPGFRVVTYQRDGSLEDQSVYYLTNLELASSTTRGEWKKEYTFSQTWKLQQLDADSLATLYNRMKSNPDDRDTWLKFYDVSSAAALLPPNSSPALYCAIEGLAVDSYGNCYCGAAANTSPGVTKP